MATTARADLVAGIKAVLDGYTNAAHAFDLVETLAQRPESYARPTPFAYIETRGETGNHDAGTRTRTFSPSVVIVDRLTNNAEAMGRLDPLVDALLDAFTASPHFSASAVHRGSYSITDDFVQEGEAIYETVTFRFGEVDVLEGRT